MDWHTHLANGDDSTGHPWLDPDTEATPPAPSDGDCVRFAALFAGRQDTHAVMWRRGDEVGYAPVRAPLGPDRVAEHLAGRVTLGTYLLRSDGRCGLVCFDLDLTREARAASVRSVDEARARWSALRSAALHLHDTLVGLGLDPLLESSGGKGMHVWLFLPEPRPAGEIRAFATELVDRLGSPPPGVALEVFPKQDRLRDGGLGNLVKLPLGRHLGSGRFSQFHLADGTADPDPHRRLRTLRRRALPSTVPEGLALFPGGGGDHDTGRAPVVAVREAPWTEGDFEASPEVGPILRGCPVLRELVARALGKRALSHDAAVVLEHTLGHTADGVRAVNYLLDRVPGTEDTPRMGAPHRGSPMSCRRVRQRVPEIVGRIPCACPLEPKPGGYPTPLLHLEKRARPPEPPGPQPLDELLEALARAEDRLDRLRDEVAALRERVARRLDAVPGRCWAIPGGEWRLEDVDGIGVVTFVPTGGSS